MIDESPGVIQVKPVLSENGEGTNTYENVVGVDEEAKLNTSQNIPGELAKMQGKGVLPPSNSSEAQRDNSQDDDDQFITMFLQLEEEAKADLDI